MKTRPRADTRPRDWHVRAPAQFGAADGVVVVLRLFKEEQVERFDSFTHRNDRFDIPLVLTFRSIAQMAVEAHRHPGAISVLHEPQFIGFEFRDQSLQRGIAPPTGGIRGQRLLPQSAE